MRAAVRAISPGRRTLVGLACWAALTASESQARPFFTSDRRSPVGPVDVPLPIPRPPDIDALPPQPPSPAPVPEKAGEVFGPPMPPRPQQASDCPVRLRAANILAETAAVPRQPDPRCTVADPVRLTGLQLADGTRVSFPDQPLLACQTVETFAGFVRDLLVPLARGTYGAPVSMAGTGPGLECRSRDHIPGAKLSAHGQGLAIDIAAITLADKRVIAIGAPKTDLDRAFDTAARAGGCGYFHTALGPGADAFHETHWHFDILPRGSKGDSKFCQ